MKTARRSRLRQNLSCGVILLFLLVFVALGAMLLLPLLAERMVGPATPALSGAKLLKYSALMLWYDGLLTRPADSYGPERRFVIAAGEAASDVAQRLEQDGLVPDGAAFRAYLIYSGLETRLQAGEFTLSAALSPLQIASHLLDATPTEIKFVILPGWRMEEIAASLPTSGLGFSPEAFLIAARAPQGHFDFLPDGAGAEGFFLPDEYILPRDIAVADFVNTLISHFALSLRSDLRAGFTRQGLDVYQAVTLASIIQREAVVADEQPLIASVFLNRLAAGMKLETDPTVQYALGYAVSSQSWWKAPLLLSDLQVVSPYNTYQIFGLPPAPISNPALNALQAVAAPAQTPYYFFRARCDGSGLHFFAETFDEHLKNACP
jgi:UPF0755 protein